MKKNTHPKYKEVSVTCNCGFQFVTRSTLGKEKLLLEVCSNCHPFYTGTQKLVDTAGRVDKFRQKYSKAIKKVEAKPVEENKSKPVTKTKPTSKTTAKETKQS